MYNYWRGCLKNGGNESLASNRVVGDSNPSGCAKYITHLTHSSANLHPPTNHQSSHKNKNTKVVIDSWSTIVGGVLHRQ